MKEGEKIRIVIVDDHPIVRQGVIPLFQTQPELSVIGEASDGDQAVETILSLRPDVAIVDLHMPRLHGIEVIRRVRKSNSHVRLAVLTASSDPEEIEEAFRAGASAYVPKHATLLQLVEAIHVIMDGGTYINPLCELPSQHAVAAALKAKRERIARELRDTALRSLAGVKRDLKLLRPHLDSASAEALDRLKRSQELLSIALDQIRRVAHDLSPPDRSDVN